MTHNEVCFFQEGNCAGNPALAAWYTEKLQCIDKCDYEDHLNCKDSIGNTLIHAAVHAENLEALQYMVSLKNADLNVRNNVGLTPLLLCLNKNLKSELAKCLIEAGCDVNVKYGFWDTTALMLTAQSYHDNEIAYMLIKYGADINATNKYKNTALHTAVCAENYEIVCMLLYYGVDADEPNEYDETPFLMALAGRDTDIQDILLNYVTDVNRDTTRYSLLMVALEYQSSYYAEILNRGADVNYFVDDTNCLNLSLNMPNNEAFKQIWKKFDYSEVYENMTENILINLRNCTLPNDDWLECLYILLTSEHVEKIINHFYKQVSSLTTLVKWIAWSFFLRQLPEDKLYEYVCLVLTSGETIYFTDIEAVYMTYGYGDTLKLLLLMGITPNCCYKCPLPYFICNFSKNEFEIIDGQEIKEIVYLKQMVFTNERPIKEKYYDTFPEFRLLWSKPKSVPSLVELTRNIARKAIALKCTNRSSCQFYTILRQMKLPVVIEAILCYMEPIYF